jgi:hypothetical protein
MFRDNLFVSFSRIKQSILLELPFLLRWERYFPETSVTKYQPKPRSIPQEQRPELHQGGRQIPRNNSVVIVYHYCCCSSLLLFIITPLTDCTENDIYLATKVVVGI